RASTPGRIAPPPWNGQPEDAWAPSAGASTGAGLCAGQCAVPAAVTEVARAQVELGSGSSGSDEPSSAGRRSLRLASRFCAARSQVWRLKYRSWPLTDALRPVIVDTQR